jgi:acetyl-CoA C-acetyltransferase
MGGTTTGGGIDPRTPVIVGVGQLSQHVERGEPVLEPVDLMAEALRRAEADAGTTGLLAAADDVRVMSLLSWRYRDPGALVAERLGISPARTGLTVMGGNYVQTIVNTTARDIAEGRTEVVLLAGGEAWRSRTAARAAGEELPWTTQDEDVAPDTVYGADDPELMGPAEVAREIYLPIQLYPMFDVALRAHEGLGVAEHRARIATLWSAFSDVAAGNPEAWSRQRYTAEELATASPTNRMVGFPYTKMLNSNNNVEQGAALILCSAGRAAALGVPRDRWVFPHAGTDAHDHWFVSNRDELHASPAIRHTGRRVLELAGVGVDDLAHVDLYSCFPSAVQVAARELGLGLDRQLTVTGGMTFAGGPWNNYVMHSIATMVGLLREDPSARGLVTANGGYLTKHAMGIYGAEPPTAGFRWESCQSAVDALPRREVATDVGGEVDVEAYTVMHARDGSAEQAFAALRTPDGRRAWGRSGEPALLEAMEAEEWVGRPVRIDAEGTIHA